LTARSVWSSARSRCGCGAPRSGCREQDSTTVRIEVPPRDVVFLSCHCRRPGILTRGASAA
jgi:hypothetical protein